MFLKINTLICQFSSQASSLLGPNVSMFRSGDELMLPEYVNVVGIAFLGCMFISIICMKLWMLINLLEY